MHPKLPVVVFSDGLLFDDPSSLRHASGAIAALARERIPLVLCSGKTRAEIEVLHQTLGIRHPFISETGAALFVPGGYFDFAIPDARDVAGYQLVEFGKPHAEVVQILHE